MRRRLPVVAALLVLASAKPVLWGTEKLDTDRDTPAPASEPIPVTDFFRPPALDWPALNPSGTYLAALIAVGEDHTQLMVYDLNTRKIDTLGAEGHADIYTASWLNDQLLICGISVYKQFGIGFLAAKVGALDRAYPLMQYVGSKLIAIPPEDRLHPLVHLVANSLNTGPYGEVVSLNADLDIGRLLDLSVRREDTGQQIDNTMANNTRHIFKRYPILKTESGFDEGYLADKEGRLAFGFVSDNGILTLHQLVGDSWVKCPENLDEIDVIGCGDNPGEIVVLGPRNEGRPRPLEVLDGASGKVKEVLISDKAYDASAGLYRDPVSHDIVGAVYPRAGPHVVWFTEAYRNLQKLVDGLFPGQVVRILGNDEKGKVVLISSYSDRQPPIYSWVDLGKHAAGLIKNSMPWIDPQRMRPMSIIKFSTRDGRRLDAYVTMPAGASRTSPPPMVVLPHSEVSSRDVWGYDGEVQFIASRGYAVLQPEYRGSTGSTWMFPLEDEWAFRKMRDDVTDATREMIASGLVDRNRVAIVGTGFGGFLALSGAAYEPSLYRCAVAVSATCDWGRLISDYKHDKYSDSFYSRMVIKLGDPRKDPQKWDEIAPQRHAEQIRSPVLIAMGEYDPPANLAGAKSIASIMAGNHVPVETMSFQEEAGGPKRLADIVELQTRIESFLAKYLQPAPAAPAVRPP